MTKKFKTFEQLHPHEEKELNPIGKKQKLHAFDEKGKNKMSANLKSHFPDRIWNKVNEKRKGRKV